MSNETGTTTMKENLVSSKLLEKSKKDIKTILQRVKGALSSLPNVEEDGIADLNAVLNMFFTPTFISQFLDAINRAHVPSDCITIPQFEASLKCLWNVGGTTSLVAVRAYAAGGGIVTDSEVALLETLDIAHQPPPPAAQDAPDEPVTLEHLRSLKKAAIEVSLSLR